MHEYYVVDDFYAGTWLNKLGLYMIKS